jgi:hypothetical protein
MKILTLSESELVSGGFRINPRSPVDCVPFEDVEREDAMSLYGIRGLGALPIDAAVAPVATPIAFAKPNPQVSGAAADHSAKGNVDFRASRPAEFGSGRTAGC